MSIAERELIELVLQLPPELRGEVRDFAEFLLRKQQRTDGQPTTQNTITTQSTAGRLRQDWAGALAHVGTTLSAVELQHQASDWMTASALKHMGNDVSS